MAKYGATPNTIKPYLHVYKKGVHKDKKTCVCGRQTVCAGRPVAAAEGGGAQGSHLQPDDQDD
jgi:hypothetical protein